MLENKYWEILIRIAARCPLATVYRTVFTPMPPTSSLSPLPGLLRFALIVFHAGMILLAVVYLRRRKLSLAGYLTWGLFAALVPYLGPFLLIYLQPGTPLPQQERTPGPSHWRASLYTFLRKLDSYPKPKRKSSPPRIPPEV